MGMFFTNTIENLLGDPKLLDEHEKPLKNALMSQDLRKASSCTLHQLMLSLETEKDTIWENNRVILLFILNAIIKRHGYTLIKNDAAHVSPSPSILDTWAAE